MTPEKKVQAAVLRWARQNDIVFIRLALQPYVETGWPDVVFLLPRGISVWMEFKRPGKKPTPKQEAKLDVLRKKQFICCWADNADAAIGALSSAMDAIALYG